MSRLRRLRSELTRLLAEDENFAATLVVWLILIGIFALSRPYSRILGALLLVLGVGVVVAQAAARRGRR